MIEKFDYKVILRLEGALLFLASLKLFDYLGSSWWLYLGLFFVFDVSMIGYIKSKPLGALTYNIGHSLIIPLAILLVGGLTQQNFITLIATIWIGHIGFDRACAFGLKLKTGFEHTHLGDINVKRK